MTPEELSAAITSCLKDAVDAGELTVPADALPREVRVERPKSREHGDWATSIALQLAKPAGVPPRKIAEVLQGRLAAIPGVSKVDIAGPGFLNVTVDAAAAGGLAKAIVEAGASYGTNTGMAGTRINLEFVSANPTGPIHLGGTRWAAVGDSLARIFQSQGADVTREYYFNDHGNQIDRFARSLLASAKGEPAPEDGYGGAYIEDIAKEVMSNTPDILSCADPQEEFRAQGVELMFASIRASLHEFGVDFDVYFHENSLFEDGAVEKLLEQLKASGNLYAKDGAWWLNSTGFGDDKDRVVIKSDGHAAYIAGDIAYFKDKRDRGFDLCIYMLGADHHGYVARLKAAAAAMGDDANRVEVLIGQMVNLVKDGVPLRMSKRAGTVVTMEDLVDIVGTDAARYSLARFSSDSNIDIDLDVLTKKSNENPVFYVQYAHARTCAVGRNAAAAGVERTAFDAAALSHPTESELLAVLGQYPGVLTQAAAFREPHRVARHLEVIAGAYHRWYDACRVTPMGDDAVTDVNRTRLWLNDAVGQVLANGLSLLGVSAPERM
ncbi:MULTISPECIES: arginine--tRNA ligase [unclassified Arthrobacter]|uniref:arginine--tRNA ligase n=1 Tax=unclassified Arthrobacter TaxID=235627 RepID=UPI00159DB49A|nr:arginine--tRNA ligase [Arthrobacter sp. STN4]MCQ9163312.1 arginine--tRNA ligase [Arthrobacter sp. STN4]NVM98840.1 arginine--tRNA ligase [Arthrobacter sp. SDTb3-6]